jgi:hypothetical protein
MKNILIYGCVAASLSGGPFSPILSTSKPITQQESIVTAYAFSLPVGKDQTNLPAMPLAQVPLGKAHAHNDYEHERPLFDALSHGFNFIEVDVWLIDNDLYVSHLHPVFLDQNRTLKSLYLDPLDKLIRQNEGRVFTKSDEPLYLMIDIKTCAGQTYEALKSQLEPFLQWITSFENDETLQKAVNIFLSGNRPVETMAGEPHRLMALDGRIDDLGKGYPSSLMPVVSERFSNVFGWEVPGLERTDNQWQVFRRLTRLVHAEGKKMRLWASPEDEAVWGKLLEHGADLINTDQLERLRFFLLKREKLLVNENFTNS